MKRCAHEVRAECPALRVTARLTLLILCGAVLGFASQTEKRDAEVRHLFLEIERAARPSDALQLSQLPHLYRDVCSRWAEPPFIAALAWTAFSTAPEADETPEDLASRLERGGGWPWLAEAGR